MSLITKLFGTYSQRQLKKVGAIADLVDALAEKYTAMSDAELKATTPALKARLAAGETLDDVLPDAFAAVREAADRVLGKRPFRVQVLGGIVLHQAQAFGFQPCAAQRGKQIGHAFGAMTEQEAPAVLQQVGGGDTQFVKRRRGFFVSRRAAGRIVAHTAGGRREIRWVAHHRIKRGGGERRVPPIRREGGDALVQTAV